jgi:hypothetical protein
MSTKMRVKLSAEDSEGNRNKDRNFITTKAGEHFAI